jgi:hypothetical protein
MFSDLQNNEQPELLPRVFIGSSSTARKLAHRVQQALGEKVEALVWDQGIFELGYNLLDSLLAYVSLFDFAILALTADDVTSSKGEVNDSPRDNVVFELGMFIGVRGRTRAFVIIAAEQGRTLKIPTDLAGNISLIIDPEKLNDDTYFATEIDGLRSLIEKRAKEAALSLLPSAGLAYGYFNNFLAPIGKRLFELKQIRLDGKMIGISKGNYDFNIVVPRSLSDAGVEGRDAYVQRAGLRSFKLPHPGPRYDFFVYPELKDGRVQFADYPTTLRASRDVIRLALRQGALGERADAQQKMEELEMRDFVKALKFLLQEPDAAKFRSQVKIQFT